MYKRDITSNNLLVGRSRLTCLQERLLNVVVGNLLFISLLIIYLFISIPDAFPQSGNEKQEGFFPKNYAEAPSVLKEAHEPEDRNVEASKNERENSPSKGLNNSKDDEHLGDNRNSIIPDQMDEKLSQREDSSDPLTSNSLDLDQSFSLDNISDEVKTAILSAEYISPIIDCGIEKNCTESLIKMWQVSSDAKLPIRHILVLNLLGISKTDASPSINFGPDISPSEATDFSTRLVFLSSLPENYPIERTPSWIIGTKQGEIILDGISNPAKLLKALRKI